MSDQIDVNAIADVLNNKVDLADGANQASVDYVVESQLPTAENNYTWYRLYKSGWLEQGGYTTLDEQSINLIKEYQDTNYNLQITAYESSQTGTPGACSFWNKTTTSFGLNRTDANEGVDWKACGMSAQS